MRAENLTPSIVVMQSTQDWTCSYKPDPLDRAQCAVRSDTIIVIGIGFQDSAQMRLAQDDHMVEAFAPD